MKILFVESYPQVFFGQQKTLLGILEETRRRGHEVVIGCTDEGAYTDILRKEEYDVEILSYPKSLSAYGGAVYRYQGLAKLKFYWQCVKYIWNLKNVLKQLKPDVIYCNDLRAILTLGVAAKLVGIPVLTWDKLDKPHGWLDHLQLPFLKRNMVITHAVEVKYPPYQKRLYGKRIVKVLDGIDIDQYANAKNIRTQFPEYAEENIYMAIVGSISERKGHDRIMKVWPRLTEQLPHLHLIIVGDASDAVGEEFKETWFGDQNDRVHLLGMREDVANIMCSVDFLITPSRQEGMGRVIVEAMAAEKPVIGAKIGGIPEVIVDGETGLLINADDAEEMIESIKKLVNDVELRKQMGHAGYQRACEHFNLSVQMKKVVDHIESVAKVG